MTTTIQVDDKTLKTLARLKRQFKAQSYKEVIDFLVSQRQRVPNSLFGMAKGSKPYTHEPEEEHGV